MTNHKNILKIGFAALLLCIMALFGLAIYTASSQHSAEPAAPVLSQTGFEQKYGVEVKLVAVTAAGGMVDVRLKVSDAQKAGPLLQDFPTLWIDAKQVSLKTSNSGDLKQAVQDGANLFLIYPNNGNAVLQGANVILVFGSTRVGPIQAR